MICGITYVGVQSARMGTIMTSLGRVVRRTEEVWKTIGAAIQDSDISGHRWDTLSEMGPIYTRTAAAVATQVEPWVVESALYYAQVERVARRRNESEARFLAIVDKQQQQQQSQRNQADLSRPDVNALHDALTKNNADLTSELDRWRAQRSSETADWLKRLSELHVDHYRQTSAMWRQMVASVCEQPGAGDR